MKCEHYLSLCSSNPPTISQMRENAPHEREAIQPSNEKEYGQLGHIVHIIPTQLYVDFHSEAS